MSDPSTIQAGPKRRLLSQEAQHAGCAQRVLQFSELLREKQFLSDDVPFWKGQATGNDFVLIPDPQGVLHIDRRSAALVCARHLGIGADGLIRAVRSEKIQEGQVLLKETPEVEWFMDYRNADGSVAEMCGNGVRAFVHFLTSVGLAHLASGQRMPIGTRAGIKWVERTPDGYEVDMGPWRLAFPERIAASGIDSTVSVKDGPSNPAISIDMGNPHTVVILPADTPLDALDLTAEPYVNPKPSHGSNVEFATLERMPGPDAGASVAMRVFERSVGETQACGTGACAVAVAVRLSEELTDVRRWTVEMPGGPVQVRFSELLQPNGELKEHAYLRGPARMVGRGFFSPELWKTL